MSEHIKTGKEIANQFDKDARYIVKNRISLEERANKKWVDLEWLIDKGRELCFCPECFAVMGCYEHFCEECRSRVGVPWDAEIFLQWLEKRVKEG